VVTYGERPKNPVVEKMYDALFYWYWGQKDYAEDTMADAVKELLDGKKTEETPQAGESTPTAISLDDLDYDNGLGADQYPWEGWRYRD